jgi:transposase-like protein
VQSVIGCPYCGEENTISVDESAGGVQEYVEDCQVCCQPWAVRVRVRASDELEVDVEVRGLDE